MALSNYTELQAAVRTELDVATSGITDASIVDAITRAEAKVNRRARFREMEQLSTATYSSGSRYLAVPDDMIELLDLRIKGASEADSEYEQVHYVAPTDINRYYGYAGTGNDDWYYTLRDQIEFHREASTDHKVMMHYLKKWDIASDATNWLLTNYPDIYLYGALAECEMHLRNDERIPVWKSLFDAGIRELNKTDHRSRDDAQLDTSDVSRLSYRGRFNILTGS